MSVRRKKQKRNRLKIKNISILLIITILIVTTICFFSKETYAKNENINESPANPKKEYKLTLVMAGDALAHDRLYNAAKKDNSYDFNQYDYNFIDYVYNNIRKDSRVIFIIRHAER